MKIKIKKIGLYIIVVILIIVGFKILNIIRDQLTIKYVKDEINWIENYYTANAEYPSKKDFDKKFSKIKLLIRPVSYDPNFGSGVHSSMQDYSFEYRLSKEKKEALGGPEKSILGYIGKYLVKPCQRSIPGYYFNNFNTEIGIFPPDGFIYTDIYTGEVYFIYSSSVYPERLQEKIILLSGLNKPRAFGWVNNFRYETSPDFENLRSQPQYKDKVFITNNKDIFSYDWDSINLKISNPKKIGEIPQSCSSNMSQLENTNLSPEVKTSNTFKYDPNGPTPSSIVDKVNMINAKGQVVDKGIKGTFKTIGNNQIFDYSSKISSNYENAIDNCIKTNCKKTYFVDDTYIKYGAGAYSNDTDNPAIGKVIKVEFYSKGVKVASYLNPHDITDSVTYTILYSQNGKSGQIITYSENLCRGVKGGGQYCYEPHYKIGTVAIFLNKENKTSLTASRDSSSIFFTGKIIEAELVSYQYYMTPDTGEVFPVVKR